MFCMRSVTKLDESDTWPCSGPKSAASDIPTGGNKDSIADTYEADRVDTEVVWRASAEGKVKSKR